MISEAAAHDDRHLPPPPFPFWLIDVGRTNYGSPRRSITTPTEPSGGRTTATPKKKRKKTPRRVLLVCFFFEIFISLFIFLEPGNWMRDRPLAEDFLEATREQREEERTWFSFHLWEFCREREREREKWWETLLVGYCFVALSKMGSMEEREAHSTETQRPKSWGLGWWTIVCVFLVRSDDGKKNETKQKLVADRGWGNTKAQRSARHDPQGFRRLADGRPLETRYIAMDSFLTFKKKKSY